jgi:CRP-like cAMP-binding protein
MRKALQLLGTLNETDIEWLARNGQKQYIQAGTTLIQEGCSIDSLYMVLNGRLSVRLASSGNEMPVATLLSGEILGEISFVDRRPPLSSVVADEDSAMLAVPRALLSDKLAIDPAFASRFYRAVAIFLADRLRTTVGRFGYGQYEEPLQVDEFTEIDDGSMEEISMAAVRFDRLLKRLSLN